MSRSDGIMLKPAQNSCLLGGKEEYSEVTALPPLPHDRQLYLGCT